METQSDALTQNDAFRQVCISRSSSQPPTPTKKCFLEHIFLIYVPIFYDMIKDVLIILESWIDVEW